MPAFDLRGIRIAEYQKEGDKVSYGPPISVGDAMNCSLELKFAEGRLYAESSLAEYIKMATGGSISIGVKYIPDAAKVVMYGAKEKTRDVGGRQVKGIQYTGLGVPSYVGTSFYAPDVIDGVTKYTCVFVSKSLFGPPGMNFQTKGENLTFQTPTTTGEFLADDSLEKVLLESAVCDTEEDAIAWTTAVMAEQGTPSGQEGE